MRDKAIITGALPYANGEIHLGHVASTYLPADITTRFLRQKGVQTYFFCASDDFGTPILIQSEKENKTPADYVAHWNRRDHEDLESLDIRFDLFYGTSSTENVEFVQHVFKRLQDAGHIYEDDIIQFFCESDGKFLPDRYVKGTCPYCNAAGQYSDLCENCGRVPAEILDPRCSICGARPVKKKTRHYFFRLAGFADKLSGWLDSNKNLQPDVKRYVQNWIKSGLIDWDITRDIPWGVPIPLPEARGQVFYGWFDNHLAYISTALKFLGDNGIDGKKFWNSADIYHFIGKDIAYHHYLFLPAMRMGLGGQYKLPDYIPTRGHLTLESKKISKSRNWYIGLRDFLAHYPADYLRYYLTVINPYSQDDLNFDWAEFASHINSELIGNLGNFVNRALGFTARNFSSVIPGPGTLDEHDEAARDSIRGLADAAGTLMESNHLDRALRRIMGFSGSFNQYFQHSEPWKDADKSPTCIFLSLNAVRSLAIVLAPFLPRSSQEMWVQAGLGGQVSEQPWDSASEMGLEAGHRIGSPAPLFARVEEEQIKKHRDGLKAA